MIEALSSTSKSNVFGLVSSKVEFSSKLRERRIDLGAALASAGTGAKARRSKATPVVQRAPSVRAKAKLGDLSSLESAKLRTADRNLETSGNPLPSYKILNAFSDAHLASILNDSGVAVEVSTGDIISLVRAREEAQAALAQAAAACVVASAVQAQSAVGAADIGVPDEGTTAREAADIPSCSRAPARKRVAKAVSSRGVRLRNRII